MLYRMIAVMAASLMLTSCFLSPGKFESEMVVNKSGEFTFTYKGEIWVLGLSSLMGIGQAVSEADFTAECFDDDSGEERACTLEEAEEQLASKKAEDAKTAEAFKALLGGLDPNDPQTIDMFIARVERQKGWNSLVHKGEGIFDVDFSLTAPLSHDFQFPIIEKVASFTPFVSMIVRKDNKVRVSAPGFAQDDSSNSLAGLGALAGTGAPAGGGIPKFVTPNGTFTIRTDGAILTNNTEEGAITADNGQKQLVWTITSATKEPPQALISLD
jgi:hypothetical protein